VQEYYSDALTHAFCCHTKQCQLVAQLVQLSVKKALHPDDLTAADQQLEVSNAAADMSLLLEQDEQGLPPHKGGVAAAPAGQQGGEPAGLRQRQVKEPAGVAA
jgi:hypothetical protein